MDTKRHQSAINSEGTVIDKKNIIIGALIAGWVLTTGVFGLLEGTWQRDNEAARSELADARGALANAREQASRVPDLEAQLQSARNELADARGALANAREQASRVPDLEAQLQSARSELADARGALANAREQPGKAAGPADAQ